MKNFTLAAAVAGLVVSEFVATDAERIGAHTWHRARLMGLECAIRQCEL